MWPHRFFPNDGESPDSDTPSPCTSDRALRSAAATDTESQKRWMCFNHESVVTRRAGVGCYSPTAPSGRLNARRKHRKTSRGDHFANKLANKPRVAVVHERARQQARFTKNLGTVTRAEHE